MTEFIMMFDMNLVTPKAAAKHEGFYKSVSGCLTCACARARACVCVCVCVYVALEYISVNPGNTKGGRITVPLTSCLTCLGTGV